MVIRSMTGYGAAAAESESLRAGVTVRSVNHRYLDLSVHLPRRLMSLEPDLRRVVQGRLHRGRVELSVHASTPGASGDEVQANRPLIAALVAALREAQREHGLRGEVGVGDLVRFPGAFEVQEAASDLGQARLDQLLALVGEALDGLERMRQAEGERLEEALRSALEAVEAAVQRIEDLVEQARPARLEALRARARTALEELGLEEPRLYQELVRLVDRQDIAEELQRLRSHVAQARDMVAAGGPCGKRLDFLGQEMAREANTIGSKSDTAGLAQQVVDLKGQVERFREQVQNVE